MVEYWYYLLLLVFKTIINGLLLNKRGRCICLQQNLFSIPCVFSAIVFMPWRKHVKIYSSVVCLRIWLSITLFLETALRWFWLSCLFGEQLQCRSDAVGCEAACRVQWETQTQLTGFLSLVTESSWFISTWSTLCELLQCFLTAVWVNGYAQQ